MMYFLLNINIVRIEKDFFMAKIILRFLLTLFMIINLVILMLSHISNINIYQKYGRQILIGIGIFILVVLAFYVALGLIGLN